QSGPVAAPVQHLSLPAGAWIDLDEPFLPGGATVTEVQRFHGLAHYLNGLRFYRVTADGLIELQTGEAAMLADGEWFAAVGRFNVLVIRGTGTGVSIDSRGIRLEGPAGEPTLPATIASKPLLRELAPALDRVRYAHLWGPLAELSKFVEA